MVERPPIIEADDEDGPDVQAQVLSFLLLLEAILLVLVSGFITLVVYGLCNSDEYDCDPGNLHYILGYGQLLIPLGVLVLAVSTLVKGVRSPPRLTTSQVQLRFIVGVASGLCWFAIIS